MVDPASLSEAENRQLIDPFTHGTIDSINAHMLHLLGSVPFSHKALTEVTQLFEQERLAVRRFYCGQLGIGKQTDMNLTAERFRIATERVAITRRARRYAAITAKLYGQQ